MKRRRSVEPKKSTSNNQLKISKFFHANPSIQNDAIVETSTIKSVGIPFGIDVLQNESPIAEKNNERVPSSGILKLTKFVHSDDNNLNEETQENMDTAAMCSSEVNFSPSKVHGDLPKTISSSLLDHKELNLKLTPLEQQIVALKEKYPELLLVVECGYKFQIFGEDADKAGTILNMATYKKNNFFSCSFPLHRLMVHVKKLVTHGCKVGIVRQKETTALKAVGASKHAPFKRELEIVYTKATLIVDDDCDGVIDVQCVDIPLCIIFVAEAYAKTDGSTAQIGILAFFTQDAKCIFDHFQDDCARSRLDSLLTHLQPAEIVLPDQGITNRTLDLVKQFALYKLSNGDCIRTEFTSHFHWAIASEMLSKVYGDDADMMDKLKDIPPVIHCCIAMAHEHLKQFKLEQMVKMINDVKPYEAFDDNVLQMDGNCVRNLNLVPLTNETGPQLIGSVYHVLNQTRTKPGARLLRSWLLRPLACRDLIESRLEAVGFFVDHFEDPELAPFKKFLKSLPDLEKQLTAVLHSRSRPKEFHGLCKSWEQLTILCVELQSHYKNVLPLSVALLINSAVDSLKMAPFYAEQLSDVAISSGEKTKLFNRLEDYPEMKMLFEKIQQTESKIQALKPSICKSIGLLALNYVTVSGDEYLIEVKNALIRAVPSSWIKISATKQCCRYRSPEVQQLFGELCCLRELLKISADEAWLQFQRQVSTTSYFTFRRANNAIATLDCLIALSDVAKSENYVRPTFVDEAGVLNISQGRHPVLSRILQQTSSAEYIPNDTKLNTDGVRCMIITGPNMGGKSCLLSQVGILVVLAQIGSFVPAVETTLSVFKSIFIRMGLHDEIYAGRSTFFIEMMETSAILKSCTSRSLVIIDELGRGTGTHDGSAIAYAALKYLVKQTKCITLFVTHYPVIVQLEDEFPGHVANYHMGYILESEKADNVQAKCDEEALVFLYTLTPRNSPKSFALNVARLAGIPSSITDRAKLKSESFFTVAESQRTKIAEFKRIFYKNHE
ncbi:DNA mismatch repair protein Msh3-like isoform X2 [Daphnia pulicaria]|uniref:DNA mismatch repair protein Msh3-like isoform X2 n=1 Tax=Daphnia pulicaria TaxID=35523 RepID=UPI001EECA0FF|nr:DNA mismatch repair protein Msh3-like isoform X2 [Daphnia pulicaria]